MQSRSRRRVLTSRSPTGKACRIRPGHVPAAVTQADPRARQSARAHLLLPRGRAGGARSGDARVRPGAGGSSPACTWKQREVNGTWRKARDGADSRRQPHPVDGADSAVVPVEAAGRRQCRPRRLHGRHEGVRTAPVLRWAPQDPCRSAHPVRRHTVEEGGGRLAVVEHVHDASGHACRKYVPDRRTHRRAAPRLTGAVTQRSGPTPSIRSGGLPPAGAGLS